MRLTGFGLLLLTALINGHQVCYPPYGCFSDDAPYDGTLIQLPKSPGQLGIKYQLYTRAQQANAHIISDTDPNSITTSTFDGTRRTIMIIHGYLERGSIFYMRPLVDKLLKNDDTNIIVVDWQKGSRFPYNQATGNLRLVAMMNTHLIELLHSQFGLRFSDVHLMGFSMGAQMAGYTGRNIKRNNNTIARITALDAAAPYYEYQHVDAKLDPTDADFVDVIHTDSRTILIKGFGIHEPAGHMDFYPNGGYEQPDCRSLDNGAIDFFTCSHYRAVHLYTESIQGNCPFFAYPCKDYKDFEKAKCTTCPANGCPSLGHNAVEHKHKVQGKFYLTTAGQKPYCVHHYKVTLHTGSGLFKDLTSGPVKMIISGDNQISEEIVLENRSLRSGSVEEFLATTRHNLGSLERIKVWHEGFLDIWYLNKIVVKKFGTSTEYVGCFNKWLNSQDNEVKLNERTARYQC